MTDTPGPPDPAAGDPTRPGDPAAPLPPSEDPTLAMPPVEPPPNAPPLAEPPLPPGAVPPSGDLPPPGGVPPPVVPTPGGPTPPPPPNWPMRILIALLAALVVLVAVIAGVLLFGGDDDEPVAATTVPLTLSPTTVAPATTAEPTTTTEATTTTVAETTTTTVAETTTTTQATTTTTQATTTTTQAATTTAASECAGLEDLQGPIDNFVFLDVDGIGTLTEFGDRDEDVITTLSCLLGEPDEDSGYGDSFSVFGTCPGTEVRGVRWGPLLTLFGDAGAFGSEGRQFYNWRYGGADVEDELGLTFPETGLGLGTTVAELESAYGDDVELFEDERSGGGAFLIGERNIANTTVPEIFGLLTDTSPQGTVEFIDSGFFCGE